MIDDYPEIVTVFGGTMIRPYFFPSTSDDEMERVYRIIDEYARTGTSTDAMFRDPNGGRQFLTAANAVGVIVGPSVE